jgi:hypothetical protein
MSQGQVDRPSGLTRLLRARHIKSLERKALALEAAYPESPFARAEANRMRAKARVLRRTIEREWAGR